ncbi:DinB family protein [uncultured Winogradskyella sp.]|uniref:DinB family protein n=1 Tax=uncultured Winogradskyella sp. TaxID=395353 RepID=UPI002635A091|nr:DinB family protein [uncultured Winogradskyella sp.]
MPTSKQLSKHVYQVYFGGNWTEVNLKDTVSNISYKTASQKKEGFNSILALTYHIHYFTKVQLRVLEEGILEGKDSESYNHPNITSQSEWEALHKVMWQDAERFTELLEQLPDSILDQPFTDKKYGTYATNLMGLIEHTHYHLGQIIILNKMITQY